MFGQIKQARGFRQFLLRGLNKVRGEWAMICTVHNLLELANGHTVMSCPPRPSSAQRVSTCPSQTFRSQAPSRHERIFTNNFNVATVSWRPCFTAVLAYLVANWLLTRSNIRKNLRMG